MLKGFFFFFFWGADLDKKCKEEDKRESIGDVRRPLEGKQTAESNVS